MIKKLAYALGFIWCLPLTIAGVIVALAVGCKYSKREGWTFLFESSEWYNNFFFKPRRVWAYTWGATIIFAHKQPLTPRVLKHEQVHFKQACIFGVFMLPLYGLSSLYNKLTGKNAYWDNHFEVWARKEESEP